MLQTIRSRMTVAFIGLAISPLLLIGVVFSVMSYSTLRQQALVEQQLQAQRVGTAVDSFVHELASQLMLLARMHDGFTSGADLEQKLGLDVLLVFENSFQELSLLGPEGSVRVTRNKGGIVLGKDLKDRAGDPAFQHPFSSGQTYFGPIQLAPDSGEPLMTIGVPLKSPMSGKTVGVLLGQARLKKIWELLASLSGRKGETIFIVDDTGAVVAHPNPSVVLAGSHFTLPAILSGFTAGLANGRVALAAERINLGLNPLYVVAQRSESEVLALAHNTLFLLSLLLLAALATAVFLSILAISNITRPLRELASAARQIQKGDFSRQVEHIHNDEVGELAMAFNAMTAHLCRSLGKMAREIEERKQAELALKESRTTLRQILDTIPQSIFWKDTECAYLGCNLIFAQAIGLDDPELIRGKTDFDLPWPREEAETYRADDQEVLTTLQSKLHIIEPIQQADGSRLWIDTTKVPLLDEQGRVYGVLGVYVDISEKMAAEEEMVALEMQLRQAQKMEAIGTLAGGIAHDFNNLLSPIIGYSELLLLGQTADSTITKHIQAILTAANRAKELVKQILTFSRRSEQKLAPLIVEPVIKEALKLLRSSIPSSIDIQQDINPECGAVLADPVQIHQIIMNLCTNAYQAIGDKSGIISVSLSPVILAQADIASRVGLQPGHYLKLVVEDSGEGIDTESLKRIFEPYFTTKETGKGTGLGLAVVHGIVKNYGGEINVYSEPGKGTRFNIYLPMVSTEAPQEKESLEKLLQTGTEKLLLVDDEDQITQHGQIFLETLGYQVTSCNDPAEALSLFSNEPNRFDLVITDMTMPKMTGALLSQKLLTVRKDLPIIMCTGFSETIDEETAKQFGIRAFLMKPVSSHDLAATIRTVLDTK